MGDFNWGHGVLALALLGLTLLCLPLGMIATFVVMTELVKD